VVIIEEQIDILTSKTWLTNRPTIKANIFGLIQEWKPKVGVNQWTLRITFQQETAMASVAAAENYLSAHVNYWLGRVEKEIKTNFDLEELVVHELCHLTTWNICAMAERFIVLSEDITGELENQRNRLEENMVTVLGRGLVMAKYGLTEVPDSFTARMKEKKWEKLMTVGAGGKYIPRGELTKQTM
jgi:membrane protein YqaA with SNARE-associated domain